MAASSGSSVANAVWPVPSRYSAAGTVTSRVITTLPSIIAAGRPATTSYPATRLRRRNGTVPPPNGEGAWPPPLHPVPGLTGWAVRRGKGLMAPDGLAWTLGPPAGSGLASRDIGRVLSRIAPSGATTMRHGSGFDPSWVSRPFVDADTGSRSTSMVAEPSGSTDTTRWVTSVTAWALTPADVGPVPNTCTPRSSDRYSTTWPGSNLKRSDVGRSGASAPSFPPHEARTAAAAAAVAPRNADLQVIRSILRSGKACDNPGRWKAGRPDDQGP